MADKLSRNVPQNMKYNDKALKRDIQRSRANNQHALFHSTYFPLSARFLFNDRTVIKALFCIDSQIRQLFWDMIK